VETTLVGVLGALIGILLTNALTLVYDWRRRRERIRDVQTSLRAEMRSHRRWLESFDAEKQEGGAAAKLKAGQAGAFDPFVPSEVDTFVFDAIVEDIHILPGRVIDPLILYYRQMKALSAFASDLRTDRFDRLEVARKVEMYDDYLDMGVYALELADDAIESINRSLKAGSEE
jgi:hypothetical protein